MKPFRCSSEYGYRSNEDGSTDLICLYCFKTLIRAADEMELRTAEDEHCCYEKTAKRGSAFCA